MRKTKEELISDLLDALRDQVESANALVLHIVENGTSYAHDPILMERLLVYTSRAMMANRAGDAFSEYMEENSDGK